MYIVSACLLGENCKYDGGNNKNDKVIEFCKCHDYIPVCPERAAGLPCPRPPAEYVGDRILDCTGKDVTAEFIKGARLELERAGEANGAILKAKSPSCGVGQIYDGTFSGKLVEGDGCFVKMLKEKGIEVISEKGEIKW
ncbi:MAG: DUF523 domain-containing protein [Clostridia bacterium]|nr:DUF523 domain-containing protein [Clostridia bacterium]